LPRLDRGANEGHARNDGRRRTRPQPKRLEPAKQVKVITHCRDTYRVTTADRKTRAFWERNLHLMTVSSRDRPEKGAPAIMPAGMMGDRAAVIFAAPEEITRMIEPRC
jgi:cytochrome c